MRTRFDELVSEALTLPPSDRAEFAHLLLDSLPTDLEDDERWELEAMRRVAEIANGATGLFPFEEALAQVRSILK